MEDIPRITTEIGTRCDLVSYLLVSYVPYFPNFFG